MTFIEMLLLIDQRGEKIVSDKTNAIQTDKWLYSRTPNGDWEQREIPPPPEDPFPPLPEPEPVKKKKK